MATITPSSDGPDELFSNAEPLGSLEERWNSFRDEVFGERARPSAGVVRDAISALDRLTSSKVRIGACAGALTMMLAGLSYGLAASASPTTPRPASLAATPRPAQAAQHFCHAATSFFATSRLGATDAAQDASFLTQMGESAPPELSPLVAHVSDGVLPLLEVQSRPGFSAAQHQAVVARGLRAFSGSDMTSVRGWVAVHCATVPQHKEDTSGLRHVAAVIPTTTTTIAQSAPTETTAPPSLPAIAGGCVSWMPNLIGLTYTEAGTEIDKVMSAAAVPQFEDVAPGSMVLSTDPAAGSCLDGQIAAGGTFPVTLDY